MQLLNESNVAYDLTPRNLMPWDVAAMLARDPWVLDLDPEAHSKVLNIDSRASESDRMQAADRLLVRVLREAFGLTSTSTPVPDPNLQWFGPIAADRQDKDELVRAIVKRTIADLSKQKRRLFTVPWSFAAPKPSDNTLVDTLKKAVKQNWLAVTMTSGHRISFSQTSQADRCAITLHAVQRTVYDVLAAHLGLDPRSTTSAELALAILQSETAVTA